MYMPVKSKFQQIENLGINLENIKTREGIIGYILRSPKSASIDLSDPTKIVDYALLSATALDEGKDLSDTLEIGEVNNIVLEGTDVKILSLRIGDSRLSVFMKKNVDHERICKDLYAT